MKKLGVGEYSDLMRQAADELARLQDLSRELQVDKNKLVNALGVLSAKVRLIQDSDLMAGTGVFRPELAEAERVLAEVERNG